jgi:predicted dehydrogenase
LWDVNKQGVIRMSRLRFGIIGAGGIGGSHLRAISESEDAEVALACDVSEAVTDRLAGAGHAVTMDWRQVIASPDVDAVVVALPHHLYPEVVPAALRAGKHVLQEKPFAHSLEGAQTTVAAARQSGSVLMVCGQTKYQSGFQRARQIVDEGSLGKIFMARGVITYRWGAAFENRWSWRGDRTLSGGTAIIDSGWHILDLMNWFAGVPTHVYASTGEGRALPGDYDVDDRAVLTMDYPGGCVGVATISFICLPGEREVVLHGTEGTIEIRPTELRLHIGAETDSEIITLKTESDALRPQLEHFLELVDTGADPVEGALEALDVQRVIDAAYRSAESHSREPLAEV